MRLTEKELQEEKAAISNLLNFNAECDGGYMSFLKVETKHLTFN